MKIVDNFVAFLVKSKLLKGAIRKTNPNSSVDESEERGNVSMYIISIDSGKSSTKWATVDPKTGQLHKGVFPTVTKGLHGEQFGKIERLVRYNGQQISVGDTRDLVHVPTETSKLRPEHEVCIYTAVAEALKALGVNNNQTQAVKLCLNVPLRDYKDKEERQKYQEKYFQPENPQTVSIEVSGQLYNYTIQQLWMCYEGQGSLIKAAIEHEDMGLDQGEVLLCDVGGCNDSIVLFSDLSPVNGRNSALRNGVLKLFKAVADDLAQALDYDSVSIHDVELLSKGCHKDASIYEGFEGFYEARVEELMDKIASTILRVCIEPRRTTFVFAGGGAQVLKQAIKTRFQDYKYVILNDSQYANCLGMLEKALSEVEGE